MNNRDFPSHGEMRFSIQGQFLLIEGEGPGNVEVAIQYQRDVQPFRDQIKHRPWASLVKLLGTPLLPPQAKQLMVQSIKQATEENLVATAVVLVEVEYAASVRQFWTDVYDQVGLPYRFFDTEQQAKAWLSEQINASSA